MANIKSAEKRARQTLTRTLRNKAARTRVKNTRKSAYEALKAGAKDTAAKVSELASAADKAAKRGVIHRNKANRLKARAAKAAKAAKA
jgi:small subunit ribosomal protein S20